MSLSDAPGLGEAFDDTSFLLIGTGLLVSLLVLQVFWFYRRSKGSSAEPAPPAAEAPTAPKGDAPDKDMMLCPECGNPTEAEYRYCRHCVEDTGRSYAGSRGDGESSRSGML